MENGRRYKIEREEERERERGGGGGERVWFYNDAQDSPPWRIIAGGCGCCSIFEFAAIRVPLFTRSFAE